MPPSWMTYQMTQGFGPTGEPLDSGYAGHANFNKGYDYGMPVGTSVDVAVPGTVVAAGDQGDGWGISVKVRDADGYIHNYGHLSAVNVQPGQQVGAGAVIGASGNTGKSTGPHLSYDVLSPDGQYVDPKQWLSGKVGDSKARETVAPEEAITMNDTSMEQLWGYLLPYLSEQANGPAANRDITLQTLAGYLNPNSLGFDTGAGVPTLARDMFEEAQYEADRQYALDVGRFGLEQAQLNYQQRLAEAQTRISELSLLSSQRGPSNQLAYQYNLRGLSAPAGTAVNPHQGSQNINQPAAISLPTPQPRAEAAPVTAPAPQTQASSMAAPPMEEPRRHAIGVASPTAPGSAGADQYAAASAQSKQLAAQGEATYTGTEGGLWKKDGNDWVEVISADKIPKLAEGGVADNMAVVGEDGPELAIRMPDGFAVLNEEQLGMDPMAMPAQSGGGNAGEKGILDAIGAIVRQAFQSGGEQPRRAAEGAIFDNTVYDPSQMAGQPAIQSIANGMRLPAFQGNSFDMTLPGTETTIPMGHKANVGDLMNMHQSERDTLQGFIETPREMGGLGLMFGDWLEGATRAAPLGRSFGVAGYGG